MIFNDIDVWRQALKKCNLRQLAMPRSRGYIVENIDAYNKIKEMLDTPEMESAHKFLYELDVEDLTDVQLTKVNKLYETAIQRGIIQEQTNDVDGDEGESSDEDEDLVSVSSPISIDTCPPETPPVDEHPGTHPKLRMAAFTVLYSAMKNGEIKTGESYSNSLDPRSAKADVINKLSRAGYDHIEILAIEAGDPDAVSDDMYNQDFGYPDDQETSELGVDMLPAAFEDDEEEEKSANDDSDDEEDEEKADDDSDSDDEEEEEEEEASDDDDEEDDSDDKEDSDKEDSDDKEEDSDDDEEDSDDEESDELSNEDKSKFKDQYTKAFKSAMKDCEFNKAFDDLTIDEKVQFFEKLQKSWSDDKPDPVKFMTPKEVEALNKEVIKKN